MDRAHDARAVWNRKPSLRSVYFDLYRDIDAYCVSGITVEIGGGSGNFKEFAPETLSTDIVLAPWLDAVADATQLPFAADSIANIVMVDVLHHVEYPALFFDEAARVLQPGGRIVFSEPAITPFSNLFYSYLHPEPVNMRDDPFRIGVPNPSRDPFDANQAIPTLMFNKQSRKFADRFPELDILNVSLNSLFAYPLTGGYRSWTAIPNILVPSLLGIERLFLPLLGPTMAFRMFGVVERRA